MGDANRQEVRAFDALIVSQLRRERDINNLDDLPELSDEELAAMDNVPANIIESMWEEESAGTEPKCEEEEGDCALAGAGEDVNFGMDRATEMDEEDKDTLDSSRAEAREELIKRKTKPREYDNG